MTRKSNTRKRTREDRNAARRERWAARHTLWRVSSLSRVRACGYLEQGNRGAGKAAGSSARLLPARPDTAAATPKRLSLRVSQSVSAAGVEHRGGWDGVQSCGSTWACPVCSERIQAERQAEVASALAVARARGWVVGFLTFTVHHRRSQSLASVWDAVNAGWRGATSGSRAAWQRDRDAYGIAGYLRLVEVTHGQNGWHVHVHALVFLNPHGVESPVRVPFIGPLGAPAGYSPGAVTFIGPLTAEQTRRRAATEWFIGPLTKAETARRMPSRPSVVVGETTAAVPLVAARNHAYDARRVLAAARRDGLELDPAAAVAATAPGLYLRDVQALADSMFARWKKSVPRGFKPGKAHGVDARVVTDATGLPDYFAKNTYRLKSVGSAAHDVTGSHGKQARHGNVTPFGLLARLVEHGDPADLALWHEWEKVSRGKRQLRWSDGMRHLLGLTEERTDAEIAEDASLDGAVVLSVSVPTYRSLARRGAAVWLLQAAEDYFRTGRREELDYWIAALGVAVEWGSPPDAERASPREAVARVVAA